MHFPFAVPCAVSTLAPDVPMATPVHAFPTQVYTLFWTWLEPALAPVQSQPYLCRTYWKRWWAYSTRKSRKSVINELTFDRPTFNLDDWKKPVLAGRLCERDHVDFAPVVYRAMSLPCHCAFVCPNFRDRPWRMICILTIVFSICIYRGAPSMNAAQVFLSLLSINPVLPYLTITLVLHFLFIFLFSDSVAMVWYKTRGHM